MSDAILTWNNETYTVSFNLGDLLKLQESLKQSNPTGVLERVGSGDVTAVATAFAIGTGVELNSVLASDIPLLSMMQVVINALNISLFGNVNPPQPPEETTIAPEA